VTWAIIPVKALTHAKRRLSPILPAEARRHLVLLMLDDVLATLATSRAVGPVLVVTPDSRVAELAKGKGARVLRESRPRGLNAAVRSGLAHARARGATQALVLPADVPFVMPDELRSVVEGGGVGVGRRVTLAPSADGGGTNALFLAPPDAVEPSFGPGSFARHLAHAVARRLDTQVLQLPGIAADIDEPKDLAQLIAQGPTSERYGFLKAYMPLPAFSSESSLRGTDP
jgi:2-phospho-L-lactate guanylyltransferase